MTDYGSVDGLAASLDGAVLRLQLERPTSATPSTTR